MSLGNTHGVFKKRCDKNVMLFKIPEIMKMREIGRTGEIKAYLIKLMSGEHKKRCKTKWQ